MRRELAQLIQMELKDPAIGLISVSDVEVSRDLAHAKVFVTVFDSAQAAGCIKALQKAAGFLRTRMGQVLTMRSVPQLHFHHDDSVERGQHMDSLIARAVSADQDAAQEADPGTDPETEQ